MTDVHYNREEDCDRIRDLIPAYAFDTADPEERELVESLLPACPEAHDELRAYQQLAEVMLYTAPPADPPPAVLERLMGRLMEQPAPRTAPKAASEPPRRRWRAAITRSRAAAAVLVLLVVSNLLWAAVALSLHQANNQVQREAAWLEDLLEAIGRRSTNQITLTAQANQQRPPRASMQWTRAASGEWVGLFNAQDFPPLAEGSYQVWLLRESQAARSLGTLEIDEQGQGSLFFALEVPLSGFDASAVTVEPQGGSPSPTGDPLIYGDL